MTTIQVKLMEIDEQMTIETHGMQTVYNVKVMIGGKESIPVEKIDLIYGGNQLDNRGTLSLYNIGSGATLYAIFPARDAMRLTVCIKKDNRTVKLKVKDWYTIKNVKMMIESMIGVPVDNQRIYLDERELENCQVVMEYLHISGGKSLAMFYGMQLYVYGYSSTYRVLEVYGTDTIEDVLKQLGFGEYIYGECTYKGLPLHGSHTLESYNIKKSIIGISYSENY